MDGESEAQTSGGTELNNAHFQATVRKISDKGRTRTQEISNSHATLKLHYATPLFNIN